MPVAAWQDYAPHAPKILYSVLPGPLFLCLASTSCQGIHMLRDQTGLLPGNYSIATGIRASFVAYG